MNESRDDGAAQRSEPTGTPTIRAELERRLADLRALLDDIGFEALRDGSWFAHLLRRGLRTYMEKVDAAYFRERYPHLPPDAIAERRIALAQRYASVGSGLTASAYSAAVVATLGSGGGASPATVPAGVGVRQRPPPRHPHLASARVRPLGDLRPPARPRRPRGPVST